MHNYVIHNTNFAKEWLDSYPVGNGRLGCTVMGTVAQEVLYLNEETIFSSRNGMEHSPEMYDKIQKLSHAFSFQDLFILFYHISIEEIYRNI